MLLILTTSPAVCSSSLTDPSPTPPSCPFITSNLRQASKVEFAWYKYVNYSPRITTGQVNPNSSPTPSDTPNKTSPVSFHVVLIPSILQPRLKFLPGTHILLSTPDTIIPFAIRISRWNSSSWSGFPNVVSSVTFHFSLETVGASGPTVSIRSPRRPDNDCYILCVRCCQMSTYLVRLFYLYI